MTEVEESPLTQALHRTVVSGFHSGVLAKGLHEVCKAVEAKKAKFVILGENIDEDHYKKLVVALCKEYGVPIVRIEKGETLSEWLGVFKKDSAGNIKKIRKTSSLAVKEFPAEVSAEQQAVIQDNFK